MFYVSEQESFSQAVYTTACFIKNREKEVDMDANAIMTMVQTLGFPIVCCAALFWRMMKESDNHKVEMEKVTDALNNNTQALIRLEESLKGEKEK
jgi:hypothetical protein|nr:MAG TPA: YvrJ protein family protein [Caudoviricetes sp.]